MVTSLDYISHTCGDVDSEHEKLNVAIEQFMDELLANIEKHDTGEGNYLDCAVTFQMLVRDARDEMLRVSDETLENCKEVGTIAMRTAFDNAVDEYEDRLSEYE